MFSGHLKSLDQFEYSDGDIGDIITSCTSNLSFLGVSGNVKFGYYGSPVKNIRLDQIQGLYCFTMTKETFGTNSEDLAIGKGKAAEERICDDSILMKI